MTDQSLAQLLAALRDGSFVDAQKVADAIDARVNQGYAAAYERINFVGANGTVWNEKLEARIERLERIIRGEDTPEDLVDPRPPTRLGDEFPEPIAPNPPSKAVRVDSLPVGAECWVKARIQRPPGDRNFVALGFDADWHHYNVFPAETVVIPVEPSAKELGLVRLCELHVDDEFELGGKVRVVTRVLNDGTVVTVLKEFTPGSARILSGQTLVSRVAKEPTAIQLRVGHRYKRRDGVEVPCLRMEADLFVCRHPDGGKLHLSTGELCGVLREHDLIEDLGPVAKESEGVRSRPAWASKETIELLRSAEWGVKAWVRRPTLQGPSDPYYAMRAAVEEKMGDGLSCEAARRALLAEIEEAP